LKKKEPSSNIFTETTEGESNQMRTKLALAAGIAGLLAVAAPAWAHHAFAAEFDAKRPIHLEGVLTQVELINPHSWIHMDVTNADGTVTNWMCEAGSPNVLLRRGFTKSTIAPGTKVIVDGYQSKDGSNRMNGRDITLPNGQKLFLGSQGTGAPYDPNNKDGKQDPPKPDGKQ
jgi:hypothetical protein